MTLKLSSLDEAVRDLNIFPTVFPHTPLISNPNAYISGDSRQKPWEMPSRFRTNWNFTGGITASTVAFDGNIPLKPELLFCNDPVSQERLTHLMKLTPDDWGGDISAGQVSNTKLYIRNEAVVEDGASWNVAVAKIVSEWDAPIDRVVERLFTDPEGITKIPSIEKTLRLLKNVDTGRDRSLPFNDNFLSPVVPIFGSNLLYLARNYHLQDGDTHYIWFENINDRNWGNFSHPTLTQEKYHADYDNNSTFTTTPPWRVVGSFVVRPKPGDPTKTEGICVMEFNFGNALFNWVNNMEWMAKASLLPTAVNYNRLFTAENL